MTKVYLSAQFPQVVTDRLEQAGLTVGMFTGEGVIDHDTLQAAVTDADILITALSTQVDAAIIEHAPNLKLIANYGAGFNNIDVTTARAHNIPVTNTPGVSTTSTAEVTVGLVLSIMHRMAEGNRLMRGEGFDGWAPLFFLGHELAGKTVGIIGLGSIGQAVAKRLKAFDMTILYTQRHQLPAAEEQALSATYVDQATLLQSSDIVTVHLPLLPATKHLIDADALAQMKDTAYLINAARGPIIDEAAVLQALTTNQLAGAALDVYEAEPNVADAFKHLDNVVLTPHIGNATVEARDAMGEIVAANAVAVAQGNQPKFIVNN
ncbi:NAD(P)-dependent oxidoreductase [Furfurilactobacillus siliginis]|uniref:2-hydroxyacid dehydrogenase n=1 Tax=Furfurilactobacillus siliginis TaxID=348151 RepID=A0A0R2KWD6_9LACO|nr:NAD(P)-dependent oxidoreductase [Furfurilactobacillus siliginis]KRN93680.1 glyoxylate reductase [Furfurilactobacillus siliginis]GEK28386.1 2-hydroxyacid dehydrogenase [Furfurilactobacillus siliginis]